MGSEVKVKKIQLSQGKFALVDDEEYNFLILFNWHYSHGYACRFSNGKKIYMHRVINKTPEKLQTDHVNGDGLDNQKINLRSSSQMENIRNASPHKNSTSPYKGVSWEASRGKWRSSIKFGNKIKFLGRFNSEVEAAKKYNFAAAKYHGQFARLNSTGE